MLFRSWSARDHCRLKNTALKTHPDVAVSIPSIGSILLKSPPSASAFWPGSRGHRRLDGCAPYCKFDDNLPLQSHDELGSGVTSFSSGNLT